MKLNKLFILFLLIISVLKVYAQPDGKAPGSAYIDTMIEHEKFFSANDKINAPSGEKWFTFKYGELNKVLILAPHTTSQTREGKIKVADRGTGSLIETLHILRDVPVLYTTYLSPSDPNYYDDNEFKDSLKELVNTLDPFIVIDLHASDASRDYDVDFGTMNGTSLLDKSGWLDTLTREFNNSGITNISSNFFAADKNETDTKFVSSLGHPCLQLEINAKYLSPAEGKNYAKRTLKLLQTIVRFIDDVNK